ncbi:ABC transporter ATP-binding protein [uncultured Roseibium sp.]|uniref:ABC transporter ATP-binding protein n=1 Tax=uncultured Roseibium sp. TaxID=1936171 RepID=UPI00260F42C0|nr:ABC transporter ATP-binding protein [uncultured Roseibium sp.]
MTNTHLNIEAVSKSFGPVTALNQIDLKIERGSFVCLLGPSGCGKTTLLRIIAGFEKPTAGRLLLDGTDISEVPPHKRGFGMVFQSLALFPHMSVAENIAYGLKLRKTTAKEQRERVEELLNVVELPHIADRTVSALSGGQRQRVAIARALAIKPKLFLLDEPLSALDAKLRDNMQIELRRLQQKFGVTTVLVTHDQTEAMMLADELVVLDHGKVQQAATPTQVYRQPANSLVADFIGAANLVKAEVDQNGQLALFGNTFKVAADHEPGTAVSVAVRAENISLRPAQANGGSAGRVVFARDLGAFKEWLVSVKDQEIRVRSSASDASEYQVGDLVHLSADPARLSVFPFTGSEDAAN